MDGDCKAFSHPPHLHPTQPPFLTLSLSEEKGREKLKKKKEEEKKKAVPKEPMLLGLCIIETDRQRILPKVGVQAITEPAEQSGISALDEFRGLLIAKLRGHRNCSAWPPHSTAPICIRFMGCLGNIHLHCDTDEPPKPPAHMAVNLYPLRACLLSLGPTHLLTKSLECPGKLKLLQVLPLRKDKLHRGALLGVGVCRGCPGGVGYTGIPGTD